MSAERCRVCRFWLLDLWPGQTDPGEAQDAGFGWCRKAPPQIVDRMARIVIQSPGLYDEIHNARDIASAMQVEDATLFPATFGTSWCGAFEAPAAEVPL